jgi:titin
LKIGNRFHTTFDFGYIAIDIGQAIPEDSGVYKVVATNELGQAESQISLKVLGDGSTIITDAMKPLEKFAELENKPQDIRMEAVPMFQRPVFTVPLANIDNVKEAANAHFEARLIPVGDPNLTVQWYRNEKLVEDSSRIKKTHDFGYVALDIAGVRDEDQGVYMARAKNLLGEAVTTAKLQIQCELEIDYLLGGRLTRCVDVLHLIVVDLCIASTAIDTESQHPEGLKKIQELEQKPQGLSRLPDKVFEKPVFTSSLTGPSELYEGQHAHFECRVIPIGDSTLTYEWYCNGIELKMGSRFTSRADFGLVTLDINSVIPEDSGIYSIKVKNSAGEAVNSQTMKVLAKSSIQGDSVQPSSWGKIQALETRPNEPPQFIDTAPKQPPVFTRNLESHELMEGTSLHLEAFVEPRGDPTLGVQWFKNGVALNTGDF